MKIEDRLEENLRSKEWNVKKKKINKKGKGVVRRKKNVMYLDEYLNKWLKIRW